MIHFCGVIFYAIFASGELQPWAEPEPIAGAGTDFAGGVPGQTMIASNPFGQTNGTTGVIPGYDQTQVGGGGVGQYGGVDESAYNQTAYYDPQQQNAGWNAQNQ